MNEKEIWESYPNYLRYLNTENLITLVETDGELIAKIAGPDGSTQTYKRSNDSWMKEPWGFDSTNTDDIVILVT